MRTFERELVASRASRLPSILGALLAWLRAGIARTKCRTLTAVRWTASVATDRIQPFLAGPVKTFVLGRRDAVSVGTVLAAVGLAAGIAWWIGATSGYPPIVEWTAETLSGTNPHPAVFWGAALLVGLGLLSAAVNAGLVPTTLLVMAPLFGLAVTRYATTYTDPVLGPQVVSLAEAVEFAAAVAAFGGTPLAVVGFLLGVLLRYGLRSVDLPTAAILDWLDA